MKSVGVKQLKTRLSEYLRMVKHGEVVLITDRDEVVTELRPARRQLSAGDSLDEIFDALAAAGELTRAASSKRGFKWKAKGLGLPEGSAAALLDELRQDHGW